MEVLGFDPEIARDLANKLASPGRLMNQGEQLHKCVIYFFPIMPSNIGAYAYVNPELTAFKQIATKWEIEQLPGFALADYQNLEVTDHESSKRQCTSSKIDTRLNSCISSLVFPGIKGKDNNCSIIIFEYLCVTLVRQAIKVGYLPNLEHRAPLNQLFGLFQRGANMFTRHHRTPISPLKQFREPLSAILLAKGELTNPGHIAATVLAISESNLSSAVAVPNEPVTNIPPVAGAWHPTLAGIHYFLAYNIQLDGNLHEALARAVIARDLFCDEHRSVTHYLPILDHGACTWITAACVVAFHRGQLPDIATVVANTDSTDVPAALERLTTQMRDQAFVVDQLKFVQRNLATFAHFTGHTFLPTIIEKFEQPEDPDDWSRIVSNNLNACDDVATSLYGTPIVQALFNVESTEQHVQWVDLDSPAKQGNGGLTSPIAVIATQVHKRANLHAAVSSTGHTAIIISSRHPP